MTDFKQNWLIICDFSKSSSQRLHSESQITVGTNSVVVDTVHLSIVPEILDSTVKKRIEKIGDQEGIEMKENHLGNGPDDAVSL